MESSFRHWTAWILELASVVLVLLAVTIGLLAGTSGGLLSRGVVQFLAAASLTITISSMLCAGHVRIVRTWFWVLPLLAIALASLQLAITWLSLPAEGDPISPATEPYLGYTANPYATVQWILWSAAAIVLCGVTTHQLRGERRTDVFFGLLALVVCGSGVFGHLQDRDQLSAREQSDRRSIPSPDVATAIGPLAYVGWQQAVFPNDEVDGEAWFERDLPPATDSYLGGLANPAQFGISGVALLPILLFIAIRRVARARAAGPYWLANPQGHFGLAIGTLALCLTGLILFRAPTLTVALGLSTALGICLGLATNGSSRRLAALAALPLCAVAILSLTGLGPTGPLTDVSSGLKDNGSLLGVLWSNPFFGCGFGALGDVWAWYRTDSASITPASSSLLALICEGGLSAAMLLVGAIAYITWKFRSLGQGGRESSAHAYIGGLLGVIVVGGLGPGLENPAVLLLAAVVLGSLIRALATAPMEGELAA